MKNKNTNKGITLIALVITIIVMLILVGVTISMAVNGGLFDYAGKAAGDTKNAIKAEEQIADGGIKVGENTYASIDEYLIASGNKVETVIPEIAGTWIFNDVVEEPEEDVTFTVNFTTNNSSRVCTGIKYVKFNESSRMLQYLAENSSLVAYDFNSGWQTYGGLEALQTITITDTSAQCADAAKLYEFLRANATKQN